MSGRRTIGWFVVTVAVGCAAGAVLMAVPVIVIAIAAPILVGGARFVGQARRHGRIRRALKRSSQPAVLAGMPVRLASVETAALVSGLWRPEIYCSRDLPGALDGEELRAVLLHEQAHQRARDPLRLLALAVLAPDGWLRRRGSAWLQRVVAAREIAADGYALRNGASRAALASALLKVEPLPAEASAPAFASAAELRIRALLTEEPGVQPSRPWRWAMAGLVVAVGSCASMSLPLVLMICCP